MTIRVALSECRCSSCERDARFGAQVYLDLALGGLLSLLLCCDHHFRHFGRKGKGERKIMRVHYIEPVAVIDDTSNELQGETAARKSS
jgi:hypothetical protein